MAGANTTSLWIEAEAQDWAVRRRTGLTFTDQGRFAAWLAEDPAHREALDRVSSIAEATRRARAEGTAPTIITAWQARSRKRRNRRVVLGLSLVGAVLLCAFVWGGRRGP